jgi:hypothetical protein
LLVPVAETGINGLYKPGLKAFFPPVWSRCGCRTAVGVIVGERHVAEEVVVVGEEVLVGEDVLLVSVRDEELASNRAERSIKTLSPLSRTGSQ